MFPEVWASVWNSRNHVVFIITVFMLKGALKEFSIPVSSLSLNCLPLGSAVWPGALTEVGPGLCYLWDSFLVPSALGRDHFLWWGHLIECWQHFGLCHLAVGIYSLRKLLLDTWVPTWWAVGSVVQGREDVALGEDPLPWYSALIQCHISFLCYMQ